MGSIMKSEQKDQTDLSITTNCFDCVFYDGNNCEANRLSVMESKQRIIETEPHRLYGICNLKRNNEWSNAEEANRLEIAKKDIMPLFGIALFDTDEKESKIFQTIDKIIDIDYPSDKVKVIISTKCKERSEQLLVASQERIKSKFHHSYIDFHFYEDNLEEEYQAFNKLNKATYLVKLNHDGFIPSDMFLMINDLINEQLEKAAIFKLPNNGSIIMKNLVSSSYLEYNNYDMMVEDLCKKAAEKNLYYEIKEIN